MKENVIIIGAGSTIALSLCQHYLLKPNTHLFAISRNAKPQSLTKFMTDNKDKPMSSQLSWLETDHSPQQISQIISTIKHNQAPITKVFICTGLLHSQTIKPEKKIEQFDQQQFIDLLQVNVVIPTCWIQQLIDACKHQQPCAITVFSARVGSISDNRLGGWYSYRMSKAALNMMIKTAAVEYARRAKNVKLIAFHPGTTDTPLSKPFQANVPTGKLFNPDFVATQLISIVNQVEFDNQAQFIDWDNKTVAW